MSKASETVELTPKQQAYKNAVISGMTRRDAARLAGYSESIARTPGQKIETPALRESIREALEKANVTSERLARRVSKAIDAERHIVVDKEVIAVEDTPTALKAVELAAKLRGDMSDAPTFNFFQVMSQIPEGFESEMILTPDEDDILDVAVEPTQGQHNDTP